MRICVSCTRGIYSSAVAMFVSFSSSFSFSIVIMMNSQSRFRTAAIETALLLEIKQPAFPDHYDLPPYFHTIHLLYCDNS